MSLEPKYKKVFTVSNTSICGFFEEYRYLSNFHLCNIWYEGLLYPSTENAYQASKQPEAFRYMFQDCTPVESKRLNRKLALDPVSIYEFEKIRFQIMSKLLLEKFSDVELSKKLIATNDRYLEETNYWNDVWWGVCNGTGKNNLGRLLMSVRDYYTQLCSIEN